MHNHKKTFQETRREFLILVGASAICLPSCIMTLSEPPEPILLDVTGVKNVNGLIASMKNAAGTRLPTQISDESFFRAFAQAFVDHAVEAAEKYKIQVPQWILDRLPAD
jgi:hypothetical protein